MQKKILKDHIKIRQRDDWALIFDSEKESFLELNSTAALLLWMILDWKTDIQILDEIMSYGLNKEEASIEYQLFLDEIGHLNLFKDE